MDLPIVGGAYQGRSKNLNAQVCQNLYPVIDQEAGKHIVALFGTPGLVQFSNPGYSAAVRGLSVMGSYLYAVIGNRLYRITTAGAATQMTGTLSTSSGPVSMEGDEVYLMIVDGSNGYTLSGTTLSTISDTDFPSNPTKVIYQDTFWLVAVEGSDTFYKSAANDPTSWAALDYASAEGKPDNLRTVVSFLRKIWMLGINTTEIFYNSGDATFPYERYSGTFSEIGCGAAASPAIVNNKLLWLGDDHHVYRNEGFSPVRVSPYQIAYQIQTLTKKDDAIGFGYSQEGHDFYVLTFPTDGKTLVYDLSTQLWHTRASSNYDNRHPANCYAYFDGKHIVGHYNNGKLLYYDLSTYTDDGEVLRAVRRAKSVHQNRLNIFHHALEVEFESGVGLDGAVQGSDPQAMMRYSDDGGHTWSNELWESMGIIGDYDNRAIWNKLGCSRERIYEISISDPVKRVILAAELQASIETRGQQQAV